MNVGKKSIIKKGEKFVHEEQEATHLAAELQHEDYGFQNLKYSVSEASGKLKLKINNKKRQKGKVGVRTVEIPDGAKVEKDFNYLDKVINFTGNAQATPGTVMEASH